MSNFISLITFVSLSITIFGIINYIEVEIMAGISLIKANLIVLMCVIYLLEINHVVHANVYTSTNHIPFVMPTIISGILIFVLSFLVVETYDLIGVLLVQLCVQLSFNNWYPIYLNHKLFKNYG